MLIKVIARALFLALLFPGLAHAGLDNFTCTRQTPLSKSSAEAMMLRTQQWYNSHSSLQARFTQYSFLAALDISESSAGSVWFTNTGLMRWKYEEPEPQDFLIRKDTLWYFRPNDSQLVIDQFRSMLVSDLPVAFMMGLGDLSRDFSFVSGCTVKGETRLILKPATETESEGDAATKPTDASLSQFVLVALADGQPKGAQIADISGNLTAIELNSVSTAKTDDEEIFEPDFPKGIDILDRRIQK